MTAARASQVVAEILRSSAAPSARASQVAAEVIRKQTTTPDLLVDQVVVEILRLDLSSGEINAQVDQVVAEVIRSERTLSASFPLNASIDADLVPGISFSATFDASLNTEGSLELGTEFAAVNLPVNVAMDAALMAESVLSCDMSFTLSSNASLEKGIELSMSSSSMISTTMRAALRVHPPESSSGFFLLF